MANSPKIFASTAWISQMPSPLEDGDRLEEIDTRFAYVEKRIRVIGMAHGNVLFVVVTLPDEETCRIISARKATRHEQDRYYAGDRETW